MRGSFLGKSGHEGCVYECARRFSEIGAGIQIAPNAFEVLKRLGIYESIKRESTSIEAIILVDGLDRVTELARLPMDSDYVDHFGTTCSVIHRADLHRSLLQRCDENPLISLIAGKKFESLDVLPGGVVEAVFQDGESSISDLLVGADGIRSSVRRRILGDGGPKASGHRIFRSFIDWEDAPLESRTHNVKAYAGPGWHMVH